VSDRRHTWDHFVYSPLHYFRALSLKTSMAPAAHDTDSFSSDATASPNPKKSKLQAGSPEGQSDHSGPEESEEEDNEVYEIEAILDAKRGATGSVRFLKHSLEEARLIILFKGKDRLPRQVERIFRRGE
jgi:hypothetical protein